MDEADNASRFVLNWDIFICYIWINYVSDHQHFRGGCNLGDDGGKGANHKDFQSN